ncbi:hypothetical protein BGZ76_000997 [Entomortierella beljakovae]|nr:hypothetical protein BGZ76_000997 [Entomortierella beljakovae]
MGSQPNSLVRLRKTIALLSVTTLVVFSSWIYLYIGSINKHWLPPIVNDSDYYMLESILPMVIFYIYAIFGRWDVPVVIRALVFQGVAALAIHGGVLQVLHRIREPTTYSCHLTYHTPLTISCYLSALGGSLFIFTGVLITLENLWTLSNKLQTKINPYRLSLGVASILLTALSLGQRHYSRDDNIKEYNWAMGALAVASLTSFAFKGIVSLVDIIPVLGAISIVYPTPWEGLRCLSKDLIPHLTSSSRDLCYGVLALLLLVDAALVKSGPKTVEDADNIRLKKKAEAVINGTEKAKGKAKAKEE